MADVTYARTFTHNDWIDNQDVVQAGGETGFNQKFHGLEAELDKISGAFAQANTNINNIQRVNFLQSQSGVTLPANSISAEFQVDLYDHAALPANVEKVYFAIIFPASGSTNIRSTFLYRQAPGNKIGVTVQFVNQDTAQQAQFAYRVLTLATQS